MSTTVQFFGGIREIGATKILVTTEAAAVLLDVGLPIPDAADDLFRAPVVERAGRELADRVRVGQFPYVPGFWDPAQLPGVEPADDGRERAVFVSHAHIDHDGGMGFVDPAIPVYASAGTVALHAALRLSGEPFRGAWRPATPLAGPVAVGDITVEAVPVDHDVPGATGYLVTTGDGRLAYTGDLNFHRGPTPASDAFARAVAGVDMLVTETTQLSFDRGQLEASEAEVLAGIERAGAEVDGLCLISLYERDVERCARLIQAASGWGRRVVWPGRVAALLATMGVPDVLTWDDSRPQRSAHVEAVYRAAGAGHTPGLIGLADVVADPAGFLVQPDPDDLPALLDLPLTPGSRWIHSQGAPLGPFMPTWDVFCQWLDRLGVERVSAGSSGHATGAAIEAMVAAVSPGVAVPVHGFRPEALRWDGPILIAELGRVYDLAGRPRA